MDNLTQSEITTEPVVTSSPTGSPSHDYKKTTYILLTILGLLILIVVIVGAYYLGTQDNASEDTTIVTTTEEAVVVPSTPAVVASPQPQTAYTSDWKTYKSTRNKYSFKYLTEPTWFSSFYNEDSAQVAYGAHIISNYDSNELDNYMDHGMVDWKAYRGDKPAIKIQLGVAALKGSREEYDQQLAKQENTEVNPNENISKTTIANLPTHIYEYNGSFKDDDMKVYTLNAYPNEAQAITITLTVSNITPTTDVTALPEWENVELFLGSFVFE